MYLAIDIGGSFVKYACVDKEGNIQKITEIPSERRGMDEFFQMMKDIYEPVKGMVEGVGISFPGIIQPESGQCTYAGSYDFLCDCNLYELLKNVIDVPIMADRDGICAALGAMWKGCLKGKKNAIAVIYGTGIAGALILDGKIYYGSNISAGEFSYLLYSVEENHVTTFPEYASIRVASAKVAKKKGLLPEEYTGERLFEDAEKGDPDAEKALKLFFQSNALLLINLQTMFDPEVIAIGGGVSTRDDLIPRLKNELKEICKKSHFKLYEPDLVRCEYGNKVNLLGAVYRFAASESDFVKN